MNRRLLLPHASISPAAEPDSAFDTNMVIIPAVLLCSLVAALGLNTLARCALNCAGRFVPGRLPDQSTVVASAAGLKKRELRKIPVSAYGPVAEMAEARECPICLAEFGEGDTIRVLPKCRHGFHVKCIDTWLLSHSSCPNCRHQLLDRTLGSDSDSGRAVHEGRRLTGVGLGPPE